MSGRAERSALRLRLWTTVAAVAVALGIAGCRQKEEPSPPLTAVTATPAGSSTSQAAAPALAGDAVTPPAGKAEPARELTFVVEDTFFGDLHVVVRVPARVAGAPKLPVVVALHGKGEALKGSKRGSRGWIDDYALGDAARRLAAPPLGPEAVGGFVDEERLAALNADLSRAPFHDLIVVCPYTPDGFRGERMWIEGKKYARLLVERVLPKVYSETPALGTPASTGIDGVSLGGRAALAAGLSAPEAFGALGALQPAIFAYEVPTIAARAKEAVMSNPKLAVRLLTSTGDFYRITTGQLSDALGEAGVKHAHLVVEGPHNYAFNRGPGSIELLLFHDRALRGRPAP